MSAEALEYESATPQALQALNGTDGEANRVACLLFADAAAPLMALHACDGHRGLIFLSQRGLIPDNTWQRTVATFEIVVLSMVPGAPNKAIVQ